MTIDYGNIPQQIADAAIKLFERDLRARHGINLKDVRDFFATQNTNEKASPIEKLPLQDVVIRIGGSETGYFISLKNVIELYGTDITVTSIRHNKNGAKTEIHYRIE